jgi:UV DNA damage endonuclease
MIKKTFLKKGTIYASKLALKNSCDLIKILKWNKKNDFSFFRITSDLFPWSSEYKLNELPDYQEIKDNFYQIGKYVKLHKMRITAHPGPFNVLTSKNPQVVDNCINDLSIHGEIFDMMQLSRTPFNKINIHIGGVYGDKNSAMKRFCENFNRLPDSVKHRITIENDDKDSMYSVIDLYEGIYKKIGIPIVFDYHHHRFCNGNLNEEDALEVAISTWPSDIVPVVHYSESRSIEKKDQSIKPQAHSDYIINYINTYGHRLDIMIEAKAKELAVIKYLQIYNS